MPEPARRKGNSNTAFTDAVNMIRILELIPQNRWITVREIQEKLARSEIFIHRRSLQRILKSMREHPDIFPIRTNTSGRSHSFCWDPSGKGVHLPQLATEQSLLLRFADEYLGMFVPAALNDGLKPLMRDSMRCELTRANEDASWLQKIKVLPESLPLMPAQVRQSVFAQISRSLLRNRFVRIRYRADAGDLAEAQVKPLAMIQKGVRFHLICQYAGEKGFRHLELHRIEYAEMQDAQFDRPDDFDLEDYAAQADFNAARGRTVRLELMTADPGLVRELRETPFNRTQTISEPKAETWLITAVMEDSALLDAWLSIRQSSIKSVVKTLLDPKDSFEGTQEKQNPPV